VPLRTLNNLLQWVECWVEERDCRAATTQGPGRLSWTTETSTGAARRFYAALERVGGGAN